jgi:hypothetical protein
MGLRKIASIYPLVHLLSEINGGPRSLPRGTPTLIRQSDSYTDGVEMKRQPLSRSDAAMLPAQTTRERCDARKGVASMSAVLLRRAVLPACLTE